MSVSASATAPSPARTASRRRGAALRALVPPLATVLVACGGGGEPVSSAPPELPAGSVVADAPVDEGPSRAPDVVFRTLSGERLALRDARGPTLVAFWSTSCTVCLREMPELARVRADYAPRGFELVAVAMPHDRPDTVLELAEARDWAFPVALDIDGAVLAAFEPVPGTPTSFLVGADGEVLERRIGPVDIEALRRRLDALAGDGTPRT